MDLALKLTLRSEKYVPPAARRLLLRACKVLTRWPASRWAYFDPDYYDSQYPDVAASDIPPLTHYLLFGRHELRNPHGLFDAQFYVSDKPHLVAQNVDPLEHYIATGAALGAAPHPLFDVPYYMAQRPPEVRGTNALWDYLNVGCSQGLSPHPLFDAAFYKHEYGHLRGVAADPLQHFLRHRKSCDLWPNRLFDSQRYMGLYGAQVPPGMNPLEHFIRLGAAQGCVPQPLFDATFYRKTYLGAATEDPFSHYMKHQLDHDPNPYFDTHYYIETNSKVDFTAVGPLVHFITLGVELGRNPSASFDLAYYRRNNPQAHERGLDPLTHYLMYGRKEGRQPHPKFRRGVASLPTGKTAISQQAWRALGEAYKAPSSPLVDVIVPVYRGYEETLTCLYSVLQSVARNHTAFSVVVINDASPEPLLASELRALHAAGLFELYENSENLGFVATVNYGMCRHPNRDVVLLNADTEVFGNWLDRLRQRILDDATVGTVTPLSNNATICSYPMVEAPCELALEVSYAELDSLAHAANAGLSIPIPSAVGFCTYIKRSCLDAVGLFDAETFGRGYGEENDFSMRAHQQGWKNIMAPEVFVYHRGNVSFGAEYLRRHEEVMRQVVNLHPTYLDLVAAFVAADPAHGARRNLDLARLRRSIGETAPVVLMVSHNRGGGTERHVQEMRRWLQQEGYVVVFLRPQGNCTETVVLQYAGIANAPNVTFNLAQGLDSLVEALRLLRIGFMHLHQMVDFGAAAPDAMRLLAQKLAVPLDITVHDYHAFCPQVTLMGPADTYCGEPDLASCERCVAAKVPAGPRVALWDWLDRNQRLLAHARYVYAPSQDTAARFKRHMPKANYRVRPHPDLEAPQATQPLQRPRGAVLRVAIIGAIGVHKGSTLLHECAQDALQRSLPIHYCLVGHSNVADIGGLANVSVTRAYAEETLMGLLADQLCHLSLFLSVWPETFSYTLSAAFAAKLYPVAFELGALGERIRRAKWGSLMPLAWMSDPQSINDHLLLVKPRPTPKSRLLLPREVLYPAGLAEYYDWRPGEYQVAPQAG